VTLLHRGPVALQTKVFLLSELAMACLCVYRFYDFWTTGFFSSDEYGYFFDATHGIIYAGRWFFGYINIGLFSIPGLGSVDGFAYVLPFYLFLWSGLTLLIFYKILKLLDLNEKAVALSLLSSFVLVSFVLLSVGFLTEPMGLTLAMGGIYCLLLFHKEKGDRWRLLLPVATALLFGFAGATREPYDAFLLAGFLLILVGVVKHMGEMEGSRLGKKTLAGLSILLFVLPAGVLVVANGGSTSQVPSLGQQLAVSIATNPGNAIGSTTTTITSVTTSVVTSTVTVASTIVSGGHTIVENVTTTNTVTNTLTNTSTSVAANNYPFYAQSLILNTLVIFVGGIALGWGPLAFIFGLAGLGILLSRAIRSRDGFNLLILLVALIAIGSYLVVSFIFAPDPTYFSFQNYSTIIRFSDTALPAFFLIVPFAMLAFSRSRKRMGLLLAIIVGFLIIAVPTYEVLAASNLPSVGSGSPFSLGYQTPGVSVRDYIASHPDGAPYNIAGLPYGWVFTPGVQDLKSVEVYSFDPNSVVPLMNYTVFTGLHWTTFYIFSDAPSSPNMDIPDYLLSILHPLNNQTYPYSPVATKETTSGYGYALYQVTISWN